MSPGDRVRALNTIPGLRRVSPGMSAGDILTIRDVETTSTGTWLTFKEHNLNKYGVYPSYLSLKFEPATYPYLELFL